MLHHGTKDIVKMIVEKIRANELKENDRLPSEQQLSIKYGVSRIVATRVYQELVKLGAIYSVQRQGYFVARYFSGVAISLIEEYNITKFNDNFATIKMNKFMIKEHWTIDNAITFTRDYYRNKKRIIISQHWIDPRIKFQSNQTHLNSDLENLKIVSSTTILRFENFTSFNHSPSLVCYGVSYDKENKIVWVVRYIVNPNYFHFVRKQFNI